MVHSENPMMITMLSPHLRKVMQQNCKRYNFSLCIASFNEESTTKHTTHLFSLNWQSEERKRDLLAEIMLEERRGRELSTNLKELLIENSSEADEKPSRTRKVSITILKSNLWLDFFLLVTCFCFITEEQGPEQEVVHVFDR